MIQELVDIGIKVHCVIIERGWKEIDTVEDYQKALKEFNQQCKKNLIFLLRNRVDIAHIKMLLR